GIIGMAGIALPFVETGIALSVMILGLAVAVGYRMPVAGAVGVAGLFAVFHGHAHGAGMPETGSGVPYGLGFALATASLHGLGIALGLGIGKLSETSGAGVLRVAGSAMALVGITILASCI